MKAALRKHQICFPFSTGFIEDSLSYGLESFQKENEREREYVPQTKQNL
jgi:hypothetical protein